MNLMTKYRIEKLKAMHNMMLNISDENYYITWICVGIPDEPSEWDFEDIAENVESYNEIEELFKKLIVKAIERDEF